MADFFSRPGRKTVVLKIGVICAALAAAILFPALFAFFSPVLPVAVHQEQTGGGAESDLPEAPPAQLSGEAGQEQSPAERSPAERAGQFVTLSSLDEYFTVNGKVSSVAAYPNPQAAGLELEYSEADQCLSRARFTRPGFYGLSVREPDGAEAYYSVFVSPTPSRHADAAPQKHDWYRTQFDTGTTSNCGPASAAMAITWVTGNDFPVQAVRRAVGWQGDGGTSFEELIRVIKDQNIVAALAPLRTVQHVRDVIDSGGIAIVLFRINGVSTARGDPARDLFGKYYEDTVGHYIVIKGYSLDGKYFVIYDPIPSDWGYNRFRYGDGLSMIGRNRYYSAEELLGSLRRKDMIVVPGNP